MSRRLRLPLLAAIALVVSLVYVFRSAPLPEAPPAAPEPVPEPVVEYDAFGFPQGDFEIVEHQIRRNQTFSDILSGYDVTAQQIFQLASSSRDVFDVRHIQAGKKLHIYRDLTDSLKATRHLVYQPDPVRYVIFDLDENMQVRLGERPVKTVRRTASGTINGSLYETLTDQGVSPALAVALSEVYAWQIDFFRIQRGDDFSVVFEEKQLDGQPVGLGEIEAARFTHVGEDYYAFRFEHDGAAGYYDEEGNSLRKAFLKSPLKFYRLTSRYNPRRFHPVLKRTKAHLGTDYAAPTGSPIRSTGDGVVVEAGRTRGNGNYVKIRHNGTYTTGYLHMSRIGKGIKRGARVRQGDVIGYVGSTGLATGPHVCYRFWKNGKQVDPLREQMPPSEPLPEEHRPAFDAERSRLLTLLDGQPEPQFALEAPTRDLEAM